MLTQDSKQGEEGHDPRFKMPAEWEKKKGKGKIAKYGIIKSKHEKKKGERRNHQFSEIDKRIVERKKGKPFFSAEGGEERGGGDRLSSAKNNP